MITILEGPDMAGKSTLAASLGCRVVHNGPPPRGTVDLRVHYETQLLSVDPREDVVFDRLWVGELVYGPVFRGSSRLSWREHLDLTDLALQLGARLWHVDADDKVLQERYFNSGRSEDLVKEVDTLMRIAAQYRLLCHRAAWDRVVTEHREQVSA